MEILPKALGTRPRLACELRPEGVIAARAENSAAGLIGAVSRSLLPEGALLPGLRAGNVVERSAVVSALRKAVETVAAEMRERQVTLVVPDAAVRVLLLDFDALASKYAEALPVVRFRLKKLLPFDADDAAVSFQTMSSSRNLVRVLVVAMPREVLAEYEQVVREAGFEPGAVLSSTVAALSGLAEQELGTLVVNAGPHAVTTAIVRGGVLLLHRTVDLASKGSAEDGYDRMVPGATTSSRSPAPLPIMPPVDLLAETLVLPLVDRESSVEEWAMQQPASYGEDEAEGNGSALETQDLYDDPIVRRAAEQNAIRRDATAKELEFDQLVREIGQAVSVAAAYFEDTLEARPSMVLSSGPMGAEMLQAVLEESGLKVRELVESDALVGGATTSLVERGWMAGVRGALRS